MSPQELCFIKQCQRDFKAKFGKPLLVNIEEMKLKESITKYKAIKDVNPMDAILNACREIAEKFGTSLEEISSKRMKGHIINYDKNYYAIREICYMIVTNNYPVSACAEILQIERTGIYYYAKRRERTRPYLLPTNLERETSCMLLLQNTSVRGTSNIVLSPRTTQKEVSSVQAL